MTDLEQGINILNRRATFARTAIIAVIALYTLSAAGLIAVLQGLFLEDTYFIGEMHIVDWTLIIAVIAFLISAILVAMWIHRAHANLELAGLWGLEFTPGWAVGWYFVPFANLFKPFQAMRELWNGSHGLSENLSTPTPGFFWVWWLALIFTRLDRFSEDIPMLGVFTLLMMVTSACALFVIITKITAAQRDINMSEAFT